MDTWIAQRKYLARKYYTMDLEVLKSGVEMP